MQFRITDHPSQQEIEEVHSKLKQYNRSKREPAKAVPIGVFYEETNGQKAAGLTGEIFGNWLCVEYLWVSEELRGQGIGSHLLKSAENEAVSRGAKYAFVDTFSFQAPDFYTKHGYVEVFKLFDYPYTSSRYYYIKQL